MIDVDEYFTECLGRNTLVPSSRWKRAGLSASSGGVSATDWAWAASTTIAIAASRSAVVAKRRSMVCFDASAMRFQWFQTDRLTLTAATTSAAIASTAWRGTSAMRNGMARAPSSVEAQAVASPPTRSEARRRHSAVRSTSERISFGGRVASVAWARSSTMTLAEGCRPWRATYSAISSSFFISISRVRLENSPINSSLTPAISHLRVPLRPALAQLPLDAELAGEPVGEQSVVVLREPGPRREDRPAVEASPAPVHLSEDLVGDDDVGVQLRVSGAGVEVVEGHGRDPGDADLSDGAVAVRDARPSRRDLALEEREDVGDSGVVCGDDPLLGGCVGNAPEHRHGLRDAEGEVEPRDGMTHADGRLLSLDPCSLGGAVLLGHLGIQRSDALADPVGQALVRRERATELLAGDRIATHADEQRELVLGHLHARHDLALAEGAHA